MLLVVNAGSSSIKVAVFDRAMAQVLSGSVTEIGGHARLKFQGIDVTCAAPNPKAALEVILAALDHSGTGVNTLHAAAHRIVHGGPHLQGPCRLTPNVIAQIEACVPLAPLHNPANLMAVRCLAELAPNLAQYASFDTAFHAHNPAVATRYAVAKSTEDLGIRRYGFHGLSYAGIVRKVQEYPNIDAQTRLLGFHLGNGASACAILGGMSVATTMGYSPLDGLTMGTRAGSMDGNAVLRLAQLIGIDRAGQVLNRESGLLGLGGTNDMRSLHQSDTPEAAFAVAHFCYWAVRHAGSMIAAMGGLDAIAFTGGIGENDKTVRDTIVSGLAWAGEVPVWVIPAEEELTIALEAAALMGAKH